MKLRKFELLLWTFHLSNNEECSRGDRLFKFQGLIDLLTSKYKYACVPKENLCIDESIIPYIDRLFFRQYIIRHKHHRYGIKVFKLCIKDAYKIGFWVYAGKQVTQGLKISTKIVTKITHEYLNLGRTVYTGNW